MHLQVTDEREASSSLSSELSKARAALQKAQTEAARQRWGPDLAGFTCLHIQIPLTDCPVCFRHQLSLSLQYLTISGIGMHTHMLLQVGAC